jgi:hypothetical protein
MRLESLLHLYKLGSLNVQVDRSSVSARVLDRAPNNIHRQIIELAFPRARILSVYLHLSDFHAQLSRTVNLFNQFSGTLQLPESNVRLYVCCLASVNCTFTDVYQHLMQTWPK